MSVIFCQMRYSALSIYSAAAFGSPEPFGALAEKIISLSAAAAAVFGKEQRWKSYRRAGVMSAGCRFSGEAV